ncbi:MAG: hypothetical protein D5S00_04385 [Tindallia sp. MSAO_Bac2]|nr:MAG: hypothetical protein D5S00_04385 [Tindallia sp. MSAO_Bac2]
MSVVVSIVLLFVLLFATACSPTGTDQPAEANNDTNSSLAGHYVGYSWRGEAGGGTFDEANQYIETILQLDDDGTILDAKMLFFVQKDGFWTTRQSGNAFVEVDYDVDPSPAIPGDDYEAGDSMFTIYTADMMSFYAAGVSEDNTAAIALVCPVTRYQFEYKFDADYDFSMSMGELTVDSGEMVPTVLTSGSGLLRPDSWDELDGKTIFDVDIWSHVVNDQGILEGIDNDSTVQEFMEAFGIEFSGGHPQEMELSYGYFGNGGWAGNFTAIEESLIGQNATELTSLVDWSVERFAGAVNEDNIFGVDVESGATRTVQNSIDGISGATVRISREATSYQRALVDAGIISEDDVIVGRF